MKKGIILLLIGTLMYSCGSEDYRVKTYDLSIGSDLDVDASYAFDEQELYSAPTPPRTAEPPPPPPPVREVASDESSSKLIRSGSMTYEVRDLESAKGQVDTLLVQLGGYTEQEYYSAHYRQRYYMLTIRVPSGRFDQLLEMLEDGPGQLLTKDIHVDDVTEEYIDLQIRLENKLAFLKQYKALLKRAESVKDMVEIQDKIRHIEEEIESKKGRIKYLSDQVALSTLHLRINEKVETTDDATPSFGQRILTAFDDGVQGFLNFLLGIISMWPLLVAILIFVVVARPVWRRYRGG